MGEVNQSVRLKLPPVSADSQRANKRPNESKYDAIISNALIENRRLCRMGLVQRTSRGEFKITDRGAEFVGEHRKQVASMIHDLDELFPDGFD